MFSVRSLNPRLCFHRKIHSLLENFIVNTNNATYSDIRTSNEGEKNETNQFQAATLHPKKQNLVVETIVFPDAAKEGMVRIGIDYCALNSFDVKSIYNEINSVALPFIPGSEFSGEIIEIGPNCKKEFKVGDKVVVLGKKQIGGGLSQQCFVPETECIHTDPRLSQENAVAALQGYANALIAFSKYAPIKENDDVIIIAGPGGEGLAAVEVAKKIFKANVYVVYASTSVDDLIRDDTVFKAINCNVGLTKVYNFFKNTLSSKKFKAVYNTYDTKLLHVVADFIPSNGFFLTSDPFFSPETFEPPYFKKDTGKKVKKSKTSLSEIETPEEIVWMERIKSVDITNYQTTNPDYYEKVANRVYDLCATETIQPKISQIWSLKDINKAVQFINSRKCLGKVLINVQQGN